MPEDSSEFINGPGVQSKSLPGVHPALNRDKWFFIFTIIVLLVGYITHLGALPVETRTDEGRRALVTVEMIIKNDFITPTLYNEAYFNKPPLYNWIIASSFYLFGNYSSFALRFPVIISLIIIGFIIYFFTKKYINVTVAYTSVLAFITNGRILIYDSLQGLIDITFGLVMYTAILLIYYFDKKKKIALLFLIPYLLTAIGYLMKGFPAIVCLSITLGIYFIYTKQFKTLFTLWHLAGISLFLLIVGGYYLTYFHVNNDIAPTILLKKILTESTDRTIIYFSFYDTLLHILTYPFEIIYHYAPWMILIVLLIRSDLYEKLKSNPFVFYNAIIFLSNFVIYWTSPEVYARYLFFILPLLFTVLTFFYHEYYNVKDWRNKIVKYILGGIIFILPLVCLLLPFIKETNSVTGVWLKAIFLLVAFIFVFFLYFRSNTNKIIVIALALAFIRIGFNWFGVDQRGDYLRQAKIDADRITVITKGKPLYILNNENIGNLDGLAFHLNVRRNDILKTTNSINKNSFYIIPKQALTNVNAEVFYEFENHLSPPLCLIRFN